MTHLLARLAVLLTAAATTLASLLVAAPANAGDPDAGRPEVGSCHDITLEQSAAASDPRDAVDCGTDHTTQTIAVLDAPGRPDWDSAALARWSAINCQAELIDFFEGRRAVVRLALSSYESAYFYPTGDQREAGARWVRCDVVLFGDVRLIDLPREPSLYPLRDSIAYCLAPESRQFRQTVCARPHSYRSEAAVPSTSQRYPSRLAWRRLSADCPRRAGFYLVPSKTLYQAGMVHLVCLSKTRR